MQQPNSNLVHAAKLNEGARSALAVHRTCRAITRRAAGRIDATKATEEIEMFLQDDFPDPCLSPVFVEVANSRADTKAEMLARMWTVGTEAAWAAVGNGLRRCPFLIWQPICTPAGFGRTPMASLGTAMQTSISSDRYQDQELVRDLTSRLNGEQPWGQPGVIEDADKPALRWWLAYAQMEAQSWEGALETLGSVLADCSNGQWPQLYLPEALYMSAAAQFGRGDWRACARDLEGYFHEADPLERNRSDALLLRYWSEQQDAAPGPPPLSHICRQALEGPEGRRFYGPADVGSEAGLQLALADQELTLPAGPFTLQAVKRQVQQLDAELADAWDEHTFSSHTWVRTNVLSALHGGGAVEELEPESPNAAVAGMTADIRSRWEQSPLKPPPTLFQDFQRLVVSGAHGVTVRFRAPASKHRAG